MFDGAHTHCSRCNKAPVVVRHLCAPCDHELATMHWKLEWTLYTRTVYMGVFNGICDVPVNEHKWFLTNYRNFMGKPKQPEVHANVSGPT